MGVFSKVLKTVWDSKWLNKAVGRGVKGIEFYKASEEYFLDTAIPYHCQNTSWQMDDPEVHRRHRVNGEEVRRSSLY